MSERSHTAWAVGLGAVAGAVVAYVFLTEGGRRLRAQLEPRVADLLRELDRWGMADHLKRFAFLAPSMTGPEEWDAGKDGASLH
jgi:hypothetical protein